MEKFFGKYRATVINNIDPEVRGRLILNVPDVLGIIPSSWAEPNMPLIGSVTGAMGVYMVPPIGAGVWVEFEQGNPNYPIWAGCRTTNSSDIPPKALLGNPAIPNVVIQVGQNKIIINDTVVPPTPKTGGITIESATGASIIVNDSGIYIDNGKGASINMIGPAIKISGKPVNINEGALNII
ncbi:MAG: phage baseplate assembly protein V [Bacteroidota bacterium]